MKTLYAYLVILLPLLINGAEMNQASDAKINPKKRSGYAREHDTASSSATKKTKLEDGKIDLDVLIEKVGSVCKRLEDLSISQIFPMVIDSQIEAVNDFIKDVLQNKHVDLTFYDLVCMALYVTIPKDKLFLENDHYSIFCLAMQENGLDDISADAFCIACEQNREEDFLNMAIARNGNQDKHKVTTILLKSLFRKQKNIIPALRILFVQDLDLTINDYDLLRLFASAAKDKAIIEFVIQYCVHQKIEMTKLFDLAFEAANLELIELLAPYCPDYDYANAFSIVCDSTFDGHYGPHEKKAKVFEYLLGTQSSAPLFERNSKGYFPLGMSKNGLLKRIVMSLIRDYKDLFVQLLEASAFNSNKEEEGIDFQSMDEVIIAMRNASKQDARLTPTFKYVDALFRMRYPYEEDELEMYEGDLQAGSILLCLRHGIPLDPTLIEQKSIDRVSVLLNQVENAGKSLVNPSVEVSLDALVQKYASCKKLLKKHILSGYYKCEFVEDKSVYTKLPSSEYPADDDSADGYSDDEESDDEDSDVVSHFDPLFTSFYGVNYQIGLNIFFSHDEMFDLIWAKIETKSLDGLLYLLLTLKREGYSIHLIHAVLFEAIKSCRTWAIVLLIKEFPELIDLEQFNFWESFVGNTVSFRELIAEVFDTSKVV